MTTDTRDAVLKRSKCRSLLLRFRTPAGSAGFPYLLLLVLVAATGFTNHIVDSWSPWSRINLVLHPLLGTQPGDRRRLRLHPLGRAGAGV